jgi:alanine-synthesizing transaminase
VIHSIPKPIALVTCYPANPTAYVASLDFYRELVAFARKHELILLSDLAYAEVYFDDANPPPSVLQVQGAMDVTVEFTSLSKTFSMAGWRMGFAVGNERLLAALARVKSYLDYGAFTPVQVAAAAALNGPDDCIGEMRDVYRKRRDALVDSFTRAGWDIPPPTASMFAWVQIPSPIGPWAAWNFPSCWSKKPPSRSRPASALANMGTTMCESRSGRERAAHPASGAQHSTLHGNGRKDPAQCRAVGGARLSGRHRPEDRPNERALAGRRRRPRHRWRGTGAHSGAPVGRFAATLRPGDHDHRRLGAGPRTRPRHGSV